MSTPAAFDPSRGLAMLATALGPALSAILDARDTIEVIVNPDGRVWVERAGRGREATDIRIEAAETERAIRLVATLTGSEATRSKPIVSAELPPRGERFEGVLPPVAKGPCFAIRKPAGQVNQQPQAEPAAAAAPLQQQSPLTALRQALEDPRPAPPAIDTNRALHPGAVIPASLVTALNSEAPGPVIAQVTQSIYDSATGRTLLIPQGARLIGDYRSSSRYGQSRVAILWSRLIMPNGDEIRLDEVAVDPSGAAGVQGNVDNHWGDVFGAAALGTLINIGVATTEEHPSITFSGVGVSTNYDPVQEALRDGVQRTGSIVTNRVVDRSLAVSPTIRLQAGAKLSVIVTRRTAF